ncbi:MAG: hypothetical protein QNK05_12050 [Myxococcota bacterium]|nr:hypothetical protein [Myxococcota bacterium]
MMRLWLSCALVLFAAGSAQAIGIVYDVDRNINDGTVRGTLTTDGTLGVLTSANVTDWNLTIRFREERLVARLTPANSTASVVGDSLFASEDDVFFEFLAQALSPRHFFRVESDPSTDPGGAWILETCREVVPIPTEECIAGGEVAAVTSGGTGTGTGISIADPVAAIATNGRPAAPVIPEPKSVLLFAIGSVLVAHRVGVRRRLAQEGQVPVTPRGCN